MTRKSSQRGSSKPLRWILLLALLLLVFLSSPSVCVRADEDAVDFDESAEEEQAEEVYEDPAPEPEPEPEPEPIEEKEAEPVAEEVAAVPVPEEASSDSSTLSSKAKDAVGSMVEKIVSRSKSAIDRVKSMSKSDAKKVAAAALGIWGVSVGVGWLAQTANKN